MILKQFFKNKSPEGSSFSEEVFQLHIHSEYRVSIVRGILNKQSLD